jgi:hypothetical protein
MLPRNELQQRWSISKPLRSVVLTHFVQNPLSFVLSASVSVPPVHGPLQARCSNL